MTYDEIKEIYNTIGPVGVKLVANEYDCAQDAYRICDESPELIPLVNMTLELWRGILIARPDHLRLCPFVDTFDMNDWAVMVGIAPQIEPHCPWHIMDGNCYVWVLHRQPQFLDKVNLNKLTTQDWAELLGSMPQLRNDPRIKWDEFGGYNWYRLVDQYHEFYDDCPWEKIEASQWFWLLRKQHGQRLRMIGFFNALPTEHRAKLMATEPRLAERIQSYENNTFAK